MSVYGRFNEQAINMFRLVAKISKFLADKWRFHKTDRHRSVALSKSNVFLLISCKLKTNFIAESIIGMGCQPTIGRKQKKNPFLFSKVSASAYESVRLRKYINTEFNWEVKRGFEKASVSRAVRLRECPLAES